MRAVSARGARGAACDRGGEEESGLTAGCRCDSLVFALFYLLEISFESF